MKQRIDAIDIVVGVGLISSGVFLEHIDPHFVAFLGPLGLAVASGLYARRRPEVLPAAARRMLASAQRLLPAPSPARTEAQVPIESLPAITTPIPVGTEPMTQSDLPNGVTEQATLLTELLAAPMVSLPRPTPPAAAPGPTLPPLPTIAYAEGKSERWLGEVFPTLEVGPHMLTTHGQTPQRIAEVVIQVLLTEQVTIRRVIMGMSEQRAHDPTYATGVLLLILEQHPSPQVQELLHRKVAAFHCRPYTAGGIALLTVLAAPLPPTPQPGAGSHDGEIHVSATLPQNPVREKSSDSSEQDEPVAPLIPSAGKTEVPSEIPPSLEDDHTPERAAITTMPIPEAVLVSAESDRKSASTPVVTTPDRGALHASSATQQADQESVTTALVRTHPVAQRHQRAAAIPSAVTTTVPLTAQDDADTRALPPDPATDAYPTPRITTAASPAITDGILLGHERETGMPVSVSLAALGGTMSVLLGVPRTGKTSSAEGFVQRTTQQGLPWIIPFDIKGEWHGIRRGEGALPFLLAGDTIDCDCWLPIQGMLNDPLLRETKVDADERWKVLNETLKTWQRLVIWAMEHRQSLIYDLQSERLEFTRKEILTAILHAVIRKAQHLRIPYGLFIDEAQTCLKQHKVPKMLFEVALAAARTAPGNGIITVISSHRPVDVDKDVIAVARLRILHRVEHGLDIEQYASILPSDWRTSKVEETVASLGKGEAIVYGPDVGIPKPLIVKMAPATTYHDGYTPAVGVTKPTPPPLTLLDDSLIDALIKHGIRVHQERYPRGGTAARRPPPQVPAGCGPADWPDSVRHLIDKAWDRLQPLIEWGTQHDLRFPILEESGEPAALAKRQEILKDDDLRQKLSEVRATGVSQNVLTAALFGRNDGRASEEVGSAIAAYATTLTRETGGSDEPHTTD